MGAVLAIVVVAVVLLAVPVLSRLRSTQVATDAARQQRNDQMVTELTDHVSTRLTFRRPELSDRTFLLEMAADPTAAETNGWADDQVKVVQAITADRASFEARRRAELIAVERATGRAVASATFSPSQLDPDAARAVGIHVHPDHRGKGYGREITAAALLLLRVVPGAVHLGTAVDNLAMQRIMAELGYEPDPEQVPYRAPNGTEFASLWYQCGTDRPPPMLRWRN